MAFRTSIWFTPHKYMVYEQKVIYFLMQKNTLDAEAPSVF